MKIQDLAQKTKELDDYINVTIKSDDVDTKPIRDGIIDFERFIKAPTKILWILKEPYDCFDDDGSPFGGGWDLKDVLRKKTPNDNFAGKPTFRPMIHTSYCILNNLRLPYNINNLEKDELKLNALKSIAYINIKKLPGHKVSKQAIIKEAYSKNKNILLKQIEIINPDIIIFGSTFNYFYRDHGITKDEMIIKASLKYCIKGNKLFIDAYHPAQRSSITELSPEQYCNDILTVVDIYKS